ncbi:MAG: SDR family oxidoreductase [Balneolaceae bacterium]|nr:SDR family oxidoreductase [Balneolaceae bacterium]
MKRILIIGANGGIGTFVSKQLTQESGFEPVAMLRKEDQQPKFSGMGVESIVADLSQSVDALAEIMTDFDGVVFTAGSGGSTGYDKTLEIDLDGAVKVMEAAEKSDSKRFIMVSVAGADDRESWNSSPIKPYMIAKHYADRVLKNTELEYTIIRPGSLTDDEGSGKITSDLSKASNRSIPREDVATAVTLSIVNNLAIRKSVEMVSGDTLIEEVLSQA